jgi:NADP-dependent 3-hydroxy acid dehydrogenase YdfG
MPYSPTRSLDGTVVAITGASAGIGAAAAYTLVEAGARVAVSGRREERLS